MIELAVLTHAEKRAPGPRQTVDACHHPTLGEGVAVYDNGPAWFASAAGTIVPMRKIGMGGAGVGGTWLRAITESGEEVRLDTTGRPRGDRHQRVQAELHGLGWLTDIGGRHTGQVRFEADDGHSFEGRWRAIWTGKPGDVGKDDLPRSRIPKSHEAFTTMKLRSGAFFTFRPVESA